MNEELEKDLDNIINDPDENSQILERISDAKKSRELEEAHDLIEMEKRLIFEEQHLESLFSIFGPQRELTEEELIQRTAAFLDLNTASANTIIQECHKLRIILNCAWNPNKFQLGSPKTKHLSREDWLQKSGIKLEPSSPEYHEWLDEDSLPF